MEIKATKLKVKLGSVEIDFEGDAEFLKLEVMPTISQVLAVAKDHPSVIHQANGNNGPDSQGKLPNFISRNGSAGTVGSLASFIKERKSENNQTRRFLTTARWLQLRGTEEPTSSDVAKALRDNHQVRLSNPADCLNKNVSRGFCEKTSNGFFITPEGLTALESRDDS